MIRTMKSKISQRKYQPKHDDHDLQSNKKGVANANTPFQNSTITSRSKKYDNGSNFNYFEVPKKINKQKLQTTRGIPMDVRE